MSMTIRLAGGPRPARTPANSEHLGPEGLPKRGYDSKRTARAAGGRLAARWSSDQRPYVCGTCGSWHLTTTPRRPQP